MDVWMAQDLPGPCQLGEVCLYATWEDNNRKLQCRGVVQFHCREETGFNTEPIISLQLQSDFLFCVVDRGQTETNACVWSSTGAGAVDATSPPQGWRRDGGREGGGGVGPAGGQARSWLIIQIIKSQKLICQADDWTCTIAPHAGCCLRISLWFWGSGLHLAGVFGRSWGGGPHLYWSLCRCWADGRWRPPAFSTTPDGGLAQTPPTWHISSLVS